MLTLKAFLLALIVIVPAYLSAQTTCNPLFKNVYGGDADKDEEAIAIAYCNGGGMIVCGKTTSYSAGNYDGFLLKLSDKGLPEWTKIIGSAGTDKLVKVRQTADGGFIALGETSSFGNIMGETWVIKTDVLGNMQWNKRYRIKTGKRETPKDIIQMKRWRLLCCYKR